MSGANEHVRRWQEAGLLDDDAAGRILAWERSHEEKRAERGELEVERPGVVEAVLYLGIVIACAGVIALIGDNWEDLERWARIAAVGVPAALTLVLGGALRLNKQAEMQRAASVAWLAAVALGAGCVGVIGSEFDWGDEDTVLAAGLTALALSLGLWVLLERSPQVLAVAGSMFFVGIAIGNYADEVSARTAGSTIAVLGIAALGATETGRVKPRVTARLLFSLLVLRGLFLAGIEEEVLWAELGLLAAGGALVALSVARASFTYMLTGIGGIFVGLIVIIFEYFEDTIGAPVSLMLSGAILIAGVLLLREARTVVKRRKTA